MRTASPAGSRDVEPRPAERPAVPPARTLEPVHDTRLLVRGPLPRRRGRRALFAASTAAQFTELLRVARVVDRSGEFDVVFWLQLVPHKLAEAMALCDAAGFHYVARPLAQEPAPSGDGGAPAEEGADGSAYPFVGDALDDLKASPWSVRRWVTLAGAVVHRVRVRAWRGWLMVLIGAETARKGPVAWTRTFVRRQLARVGGAVLAVAEKTGFRGLPRVLRPLAFPMLALSYAVFDPRQLLTLISLFGHYRRLVRTAADVVRNVSPDVVVVAEDALYDYSSIVRQAHRRRIPTVVVPYTIATAAEPAEAILADPEFERGYEVRPWYTRLTALLLPHWVYGYRGRRMLRYPVWLALVYEALGLAPERPWVFNDGCSAALAAESPHMAGLYRREGLSDRYVVLTGAVYDDVASAVASRRAEARAELLAELGLPEGRRIAVCSVPPRMELERRPGCEFTTHEQVVAALVEPLLAMPDTAVVLSLHPTLRVAEMRYAEQMGARISARPVPELIACADLFVAVISATIRIAIASGVPVVNFDLFRYRYRDYESAGGVVTVETEAAYRETVERIATDRAFADGLRRKQAAVSTRWGYRDGRSAEALVGLLRHVAEHGTPRGFVPPGRAA